MVRRFRFGVNLVASGGGRQWADTCRRAEQLGYDVLLVPDHLGPGVPAPFPALVAAGAATERVRLGTFVLNAGFWNPALLAREVDTTARLTGGRLELGLGTGYVRDEFEDAGLVWESAGARVDRLRALVDELHRRLDAQQVPLLVAGNGDRVLRLAADRADTVAFAALTLVPGSSAGELRLVDPATLADRAQLVSAAAGRDVERNVLVQWVEITDDRRGAADRLRDQLGLDLDVEQLLALPTVLLGTVDEIADQLRAHRQHLGVSYVAVLERDVETFAAVVEALSGE